MAGIVIFYALFVELFVAGGPSKSRRSCFTSLLTISFPTVKRFAGISGHRLPTITSIAPVGLPLEISCIFLAGGLFVLLIRWRMTEHGSRMMAASNKLPVLLAADLIY
jgi:hypothetical protein